MPGVSAYECLSVTLIVTNGLTALLKDLLLRSAHFITLRHTRIRRECLSDLDNKTLAGRWPIPSEMRLCFVFCSNPRLGNG